jgi:Protein of unknown function (DUF3040)
MLSDRERRDLLELERQLINAEPDLERLFHRELDGGERQPGIGTAGRIAITAALAISALLLLAGFTDAATACAFAITIPWLLAQFSDGDEPGAQDSWPRRA